MRKQREIARVLGTEALMVGDQGAGSLALAKEKTSQFAMIVESALRELCDTMNKDFIDPLMRLNGWGEELRPTLKTESIQLRDIEELASMMSNLSSAGITLSREDEALGEIFDTAGLSRLQVDDEPESPPAPVVEAEPPEAQEVDEEPEEEEVTDDS
jgi:phage gp29-like protein